MIETTYNQDLLLEVFVVSFSCLLASTQLWLLWSQRRWLDWLEVSVLSTHLMSIIGGASTLSLYFATCLTSPLPRPNADFLFGCVALLAGSCSLARFIVRLPSSTPTRLSAAKATAKSRPPRQASTVDDPSWSQVIESVFEAHQEFEDREERIAEQKAQLVASAKDLLEQARAAKAQEMLRLGQELDSMEALQMRLDLLEGRRPPLRGKPPGRGKAKGTRTERPAAPGRAQPKPKVAKETRKAAKKRKRREARKRKDKK